MLRRALIVVVLAGAVLGITAAPAFAHAELVESDPAPGAVLERSPATITLQFTETVEADTSGVRVFDTDGARVDQGGTEVSGRTVRLPLPSLDDGSYVVTWRVVSGDSHPIQGAFTFQIGEGNGPAATSREVTGLAQRLLGEQGGDTAVGVAYGIVRGLVFAGLALLIGGAVFAAGISPAARASKRAARIVGLGWVVTFLATMAGLLLYGPYAAGLGLGDAFSTSLLGDTLGERFGQVWFVRLVVLLVAVPLLLRLFPRASDERGARALPAWWLPIGAVSAIVLSATPGLAGHAVSGDWVNVAIVADTLHVLAMAVWLGGLVLLVAVSLPTRDLGELREVVPRFSRVALGCIGVLVATGAFQTWRQVGSLEALRSTDYGRILAVKLVLFAAIVVFAAFSREIVLRLFGLPEEAPQESGTPAVVAGGSDDGDAVVPEIAEPEVVAPEAEPDLDAQLELRHLRRSVWAEVVLAVAVLATTALLVNAAPARSALPATADGGAVGVTMRSDKVWVDVTATPGVAGRNDLHVNTLTPDGAPKDVQELAVTIDLPDRKIAPIDVPLRRLSPGHYFAPGFDVPIAGDWRVTAKPLLSEFDQPTLRGTVTFG